MAAAPCWAAYTAVFAAAAAAGSAIASMIAYRRTKRLKETDLRLELQKLAIKLEADLEILAGLLPAAQKSRKAIAADTERTGAFEHWTEEYNADRITLTTLIAEGRGSVDPDSLRGLQLDELEEALARLSALQPRIEQLMAKYKASIEADAGERERIRP